MIRLKLTKREWVSQSVRESVSDKHCQWSDSGPIIKANINAEPFKNESQNNDEFGSKWKTFLSLWKCSLLSAAAASCCLTQRPSHEHEEEEDGDLDYESDGDDGLFDNDDGDDDDD